MLKTDSDSLLCDFAQTYHILDLRSVPLKTAAVLACGLGDDSRIKMKLSGQQVPFSTLLLARCVDVLSLLLWTRCKEGTKKPDSVLALLTQSSTDPNAVETFESVDDFNKVRQRMLNGGE